jgi:hypothetical protein
MIWVVPVLLWIDYIKRQSEIATMSYTSLSLGKRYQIYALKWARNSIKFIAGKLSRSSSIISRDIRSNRSLLGSMLKTKPKLGE